MYCYYHSLTKERPWAEHCQRGEWALFRVYSRWPANTNNLAMPLSWGEIAKLTVWQPAKPRQAFHARRIWRRGFAIDLRVRNNHVHNADHVTQLNQVGELVFWGFTKFTQLHEVTSQFVTFISCALRAQIEDGTGSRLDSCEVNFHLQLALVLRVVILCL